MTRGATFNVTIELVTEECCNCGVLFGIPVDMQRRRRNDHQSFYCPHGHPQHYDSESAEEQLRRELREAEARHAKQLAQEAERRQRAEEDAMNLAQRNRALTGEVTKARKRAAAGVCGFCHRTFQNVTRHVASQHPSSGHPKAVGTDALATKSPR
jgi:hypothetical protein